MEKSDKLIKYNLNNIREVIGKKMTDEQIMDILFYCPFKFPDPNEKEDTDEPIELLKELPKKYFCYLTYRIREVSHTRSNSNPSENTAPVKASRFGFHKRNKSKLETPYAKNLLKDLDNSKDSINSVSNSKSSEKSGPKPSPRSSLKPIPSNRNHLIGSKSKISL